MREGEAVGGERVGAARHDGQPGARHPQMQHGGVGERPGQCPVPQLVAGGPPGPLDHLSARPRRDLPTVGVLPAQLREGNGQFAHGSGERERDAGGAR